MEYFTYLCHPKSEITMKRKFIIALFIFATLTVDAQFLFRISGNGLPEPSYILGTIHVLSASELVT